MTSAMRSSPSRSPLPDSIPTRPFSVSISGAFSAAASERTGSSGAATAAVAPSAIANARRWDNGIQSLAAAIAVSMGLTEQFYTARRAGSPEFDRLRQGPPV